MGSQPGLHEVPASEELSKYEKSDVVAKVIDCIDRKLDEGQTSTILLTGGPGVGKSTASYEVLDYLKLERGLESVWIQAPDIGSEKTRDRIIHMGNDKVLFIDSVDNLFPSSKDPDEVAETVKLLKDLAQKGEGPIVIANIHDPYLVKREIKTTHLPLRDQILGDTGLFSDTKQHFVVEDRFVNEKAMSVAVKRLIGQADIHASWATFIQLELEKHEVNKHSETTFALSLLKKDSMPGSLKKSYVLGSEDEVRTWFNDAIEDARKVGEEFYRAYYEPDSESEAFKGLVRFDVS
ncbi:hypothetical protein A3B59_00850 [Candidatus Beckwithbacteria bacterium RIFCSPLOWO2_01_FULL_49_47]|nr:MAG: hypothetical protein UY43_C0001G0198 [Candidatus Beckwithbacteria bacterium GW2011_GWC1_49_16]OGD48591.1 MAG: hypothetical protein A2877_02500 [Candidatus Beckwithbacteria bacterium RIFCSPHIGHO2_01_FULL_49_39]OGD51509.1 MAG: hypothetical protein A3K56_04750 [Candidatus Beckwithbacteria bacterium RIFCSPHIGHO2_12_FULL_49_13]OGD52042.1 MAG: hypothetical protein A3D86_01765 [Candidatus Beckwithbacteria bacterium RIFCSPHIGHO2_02_FULL_49_13]OGD58775.1 MAG: hypothetical protein A3J22_03365 [Ca